MYVFHKYYISIEDYQSLEEKVKADKEGIKSRVKKIILTDFIEKKRSENFNFLDITIFLLRELGIKWTKGHGLDDVRSIQSKEIVELLCHREIIQEFIFSGQLKQIGTGTPEYKVVNVLEPSKKKAKVKAKTKTKTKEDSPQVEMQAWNETITPVSHNPFANVPNLTEPLNIFGTFNFQPNYQDLFSDFMRSIQNTILEEGTLEGNEGTLELIGLNTPCRDSNLFPT